MMKRIFGILLTLAMLISPVVAKEKIGVTVSIAPLAEFVRQVGGDLVTVNTMIPPGGNPHVYEPLPSQLRDLDRSDLYVKVGSGLEFEIAWLDKFIALNKNMSICDSSKGIRLIEMGEHHHEEAENSHAGHVHGRKDPHLLIMQ